MDGLVTFKLKKIGKDSYRAEDLRKASSNVVDLRQDKQFEGIKEKRRKGFI